MEIWFWIKVWFKLRISYLAQNSFTILTWIGETINQIINFLSSKNSFATEVLIWLQEMFEYSYL